MMLLIALIWGSAFVVVKSTLESITPLYLMAIRFTISALVMCIFFLKRIRTSPKGTILKGLGLGSILAIAYGVQSIGLVYTTAGNNAFLTAIYVVLVPFFGYLIFRRRPTGRNLLAAGVCLAGVGFLSLGEGFTMNIGDALSLLCGVFCAVHIVLLGHYAKECDGMVITAMQFVGTAAIFWLWAPLCETAPQSISMDVVWSILYMSLICTVLALSMQTIGQKYADPSRASLLLSCEALFGTVLGIVLLGEPFTPRIGLGAGLIFCAVLISELGGKKAE